MTRKISQLVAVMGLALATPVLSDIRAETAQAAHTVYLAAINSNNLDRFLETVTDDVVFIPPGTPVMEGKSDVTPWVRGYFDAAQTSWEKRSLEFVVAVDWAFERYAFTATDVPHGAGLATVSTGHGIHIYRREDDGAWRVARDIWSNTNTSILSSSLPVAPACSGPAGPC
ncbi:nuclear transport factor 2 family protein [Ruegeria sp. HKCCD8929]|uniref:YybH family protein n=1 Tax=Ruegeria sp. HKCCD8929 TaxID=2683006 RepID=UPI001489C36B|nr:nuclear transport factor 2 family protein [Ruegeria sp. HKCCD8929]